MRYYVRSLKRPISCYKIFYRKVCLLNFNKENKKRNWYRGCSKSVNARIGRTNSSDVFAACRNVMSMRRTSFFPKELDGRWKIYFSRSCMRVVPTYLLRSAKWFFVDWFFMLAGINFVFVILKRRKRTVRCNQDTDDFDLIKKKVRDAYV